MAVRTIFSMAEDCARGERLGWQEFVRDYGDIARTLLAHYFPTLQPELDAHVVGVFERARAGDATWFKGLKFSNEREFLMAFRNLAFAYGREQERIPTPEISLDQLREIVKDLTVVERQALWLFIKGYDAPQIAPIMANAEATSRAVKKVADERLKVVIPSATADAFVTSARKLTEEAEKTAGDKCLPLKTFNNLVNGQLSWRERELAEEHIKDCFNCIDRFTSFMEMTRMRKDAKPAGEAEVERVLGRMGFAPAKGKGVLAKIFGKA